MNWLKRMRPRFARARQPKDDTPGHLWVKCPQCEEMSFQKDLLAAMKVCPVCEHHGRLSAGERLGFLFDDGEYKLVPVPAVATDPLKFRDSQPYHKRLLAARAKTGAADATQVAHGAMGGRATVIAVQDFAFMGGSLGMAAGEAFLCGADAALAHHCPYIVVTAAGGARMQEGILSLMQMPRTIVAIQKLHRARLPYIVVLSDPTTGGVTASYGMLGDVQIAEPGALIGFAGPRVIEQTIKEQLPQNFQRAEYLLEHGMLDMVVHRRDLRDTLVRVTGLLMSAHEQPACASDEAEAQAKPPAAKANGKAANDKATTKPAAKRAVS